jgi:hypothetical protein
MRDEIDDLVEREAKLPRATRESVLIALVQFDGQLTRRRSKTPADKRRRTTIKPGESFFTSATALPPAPLLLRMRALRVSLRPYRDQERKAHERGALRSCLGGAGQIGR